MTNTRGYGPLICRESNATSSLPSLSLQKQKGKEKGSLFLKDHKTNILINLSASFHYG